MTMLTVMKGMAKPSAGSAQLYIHAKIFNKLKLTLTKFGWPVEIKKEKACRSTAAQPRHHKRQIALFVYNLIS